MPGAAIRAERLCRRFGDRFAVRDVSFEIEPGQLVGVLGPNGAGKSTTLRMLAGYLTPTSGGSTLNGHDGAANSLALRASLGYLPENNPLHPEMRVDHYLGFVARLQRVTRARRRIVVQGAIDRCALRDAARRRIGELSKGFRQRVGLAAAILHDPPALILDEPTTGLDPAQTVETRRLLRELAGEHTVLLSTHILPEVERTCDRVILIARGRVAADGSPAALAASAPNATGRVVVEAREREGAPGLGGALGALPGVAGVERTQTPDGWSRFVLAPASPALDLREPAARACSAAGATVRELRPEEPRSLEALFARALEAPDEPEGDS